MQRSTVARIVRASVVAGLALQVATIVVVGLASSQATSGPFIGPTASAAMIVTLALQAIYLVVQLAPNGRAHVPVLTKTDDGWMIAILCTALPGVLWHNLGALAGHPLDQIMPGFVTPLLVSALLLIGRLVQLRRVRAVDLQASQH